MNATQRKKEKVNNTRVNKTKMTILLNLLPIINAASQRTELPSFYSCLKNIQLKSTKMVLNPRENSNSRNRFGCNQLIEVIKWKHKQL